VRQNRSVKALHKTFPSVLGWFCAWGSVNICFFPTGLCLFSRSKVWGWERSAWFEMLLLIMKRLGADGLLRLLG